MSNYEPLPYAGLIMHEYTREYPTIKTVNYFTSNLVHRRKIKAGAADVVFHNGDEISEASRSNIFVVREGLLRDA